MTQGHLSFKSFNREKEREREREGEKIATQHRMNGYD